MSGNDQKKGYEFFSFMYKFVLSLFISLCSILYVKMPQLVSPSLSQYFPIFEYAALFSYSNAQMNVEFSKPVTMEMFLSVLVLCLRVHGKTET